MKFEAFEGEATNLSCDLLAVPCFAEKLGDNSVFAALDARLGGVLTRAAEDERFEGKPGQSLTLHSHGKVGATRILLVGVGPRADVQVPEIRHVAARAARLGRGLGAKHVGVVLHGGFAGERGAQHAAEGALLGNYKFDRYLSADSRRPDVLEKVSVVGAEAADQFARAASRAEIVAAAICRARDYINEPAGEMTPVRMAAEAERIAQKHGLGVEVLGPAECRSLGMGMFLGVAQGSDQEPRFIHLSYKPKGTAQKRVAIIGKGVTFDSGGLSLKPSQAMEDMKVDMSGAAAVISAMAAIAELAPSVEIHAIAACTENMPSGNSYKLGDVLKSMDGKTVEINNTDAEGRLTLGDAITFAKRLSDRRLRRRARPAHRGCDDQSPANGRPLARRRQVERRGHVAAASFATPSRAAEERDCRHAEHRRALWRRAHRRTLPQGVRRRYALGARRHRRPCVRRQGVGSHPRGRDGLRGRHDRRVPDPLVSLSTRLERPPFQCGASHGSSRVTVIF
jgi:leucyl aminopeptidase